MIAADPTFAAAEHRLAAGNHRPRQDPSRAPRRVSG